MKLQMFKIIAFLVLLAGWFSCAKDEDDPNAFKWDYANQREEFRPVNQGKKSSYFKIDNNIVSFAVPYLVGTWVIEYPSEPDDLGMGGYTPHLWSIWLIMAKGTDVTKLAPVVTLAPGATIKRIEWSISNKFPSKPDDYVAIDDDYTGIADVGVINFKYQVDFTVRTPGSSNVIYKCVAIAIGDH